MDHLRHIVLIATVAWMLPTVAASAAERRGSHPPIFVATRTMGSPITPYFFPYGSRYRYNRPGPVFYHLPDSGLEYWRPDPWGPYYWRVRYGCRLWRYNYLYWTC
jgi:hypothetical protein